MAPVTLARFLRPAGLTLLILAAPRATGTDDFARALERHRAVVLAEVTVPATGEGPAAAQIREWTQTLLPDGRWPDIDYAHQEWAGWDAVRHLRRVRQLALALVAAPPAAPAGPELERAILRALDHWLSARYTNPNWWHNDIGVPQLMRDILLLLEPRLTCERREGALSVVRQVRVQTPGNGANTVWTADLALSLALFERDENRVAATAQLLGGEIAFADAAGLQPDFSYHLHGPRLQQFHYGMSFLRDTVRVAWQLHGTRWALAPEQVRLLVDTLLEGHRWMSRGRVTVPGTLDRAVSRAGALASADLRGVLRLLRDITGHRQAELDAFIAHQSGEGASVAGFRSFPRSDFSVYHARNYSWFLKTVSDRTEPPESINQENLRGGRLAQGDHYLLRDGAEYAALPPVWDWDLLPGVTGAPGAGLLWRRPFVGSVSDGRSGATVMDVALGPPESVALTARKVWICHDDVVLSLIGGLGSEVIAAPVRTALDQCRLRGRVTAAPAGGGWLDLARGEHPAEHFRWIHHAGFAYVPLGGVPVSLKSGDVTGTWASINAAESAEPVTEPVFLPVLEHGVIPAQQSSGFAIFAAATPEEVDRRMAAPPWRVIRNDGSVQAVSFVDGTVFAAFWEPGCLEDGGRPVIEVDQPCLLIVRDGILWVADPTQTGRLLTVVVAGTEHSLLCPPGGRTAAPVELWPRKPETAEPTGAGLRQTADGRG